MNFDKPIYLFYHTYLAGDYKIIIQDQIQKVFLSGLYHACHAFYIYVSAPAENKHNIRWVEKITNKFDKIKVNIIDIDKTNLPSEYRESKITLLEMRKFAESNDGYYCYFHTKGTHNIGYNISMWRISCDWALFGKWKTNIQMLMSDGYDAVGPNLRYNTFLGYYPHFSGNFWRANGEYLKKLNDEYLYDTKNKYLEEFWIGSNTNSKLGSVYECGQDAPYLIATEIDNFVKI
jgi:hypothetical protein